MSITNNTPIKITKKSRLVEIKKVIEDFKQSFFDQFGIKIYTKYEYLNPDIEEKSYINVPILNLQDFEIVAQNVYAGKIDPHYILHKGNRKREVVLIRQLVFKEALKLGYGPSEIADHFGWSHSNIIAARIAIHGLLDSRNEEALNLEKKVHHEIEQRIISKGINEFDS